MANELKAFSGRNPSQNAFELRSFIQLLQLREVTAYLEIGAREGDTFHEVMINLPRGSRGVAIDLPGGLWGKATTRDKLLRAMKDLKQRGYIVSHWFGDSGADSTRSVVRMRGPYGAALIDGDHTYEGVKRDWMAYGNEAPLVAFHDIVGTGQRDKHRGCEVEVPKLWAEIKQGRSVIEYVDDGSKMGIGVILND